MRAGFSLQAGYWICDRATEAGSIATLHHIELQSYLLASEGKSERMPREGRGKTSRGV
jgi:hypothetical protein